MKKAQFNSLIDVQEVFDDFIDAGGGAKALKKELVDRVAAAIGQFNSVMEDLGTELDYKDTKRASRREKRALVLQGMTEEEKIAYRADRKAKRLARVATRNANLTDDEINAYNADRAQRRKEAKAARKAKALQAAAAVVAEHVQAEPEAETATAAA